jgi:sodium-dependent dicarboxylate transporter 2/3/5
MTPATRRKAMSIAALALAEVVAWAVSRRLEAPEARALVGVFALVLVAWVTEIVPVAVTALMIGPLLVATGVCEVDEAFRPYADPLLFLFVGSFMLAESMKRHGLDRRFARFVVSLPFVRGSALRTHVALVAAATLMSMWISNTATCAIFVPILLGMRGMEKPEGEKEDPATAPLLAIAFVSTTAGLGTLVGTPPNLITVRILADAGVHIGFLEWMAIGVPAALLLSAVAGGITLFRARRGVRALGAIEMEPPRPWSRGEVATAVCFGLAVLGWIVPSLCQAAGLPFAEVLVERAHPGVVALLACLPLFLVPDPSSREQGQSAAPPVLPWRDAVRIDWGVILLFGGGISLGAQLEETGLASAMSRGIVEATGAADVWTLCAAACFATILLSEIASNTAAANMLVPIVIALARELGVSPIAPALAVGLGASVGFMLPIATGPNALAYATGRIPQRAMMKAGFLLDVACFFLVLALLRIVCPLMGWM